MFTKPIPKQTKQVLLEFSVILKILAPTHLEHLILLIGIASSEIIFF